MGHKGRQIGWLAVLAAAMTLGAALPAARAQVTIGENTEMNLNGDLSFGYSGVFSDQSLAASTNQYAFGGNLNLFGHYYHPQFLSFHLNPYYNQSRLNSNYQSIFSAKGLNAGASLFSGSHTPITVSYDRAYNNQGQFSIPGSANVETTGESQSFNVSAGAYYEGLPSLTVGYNQSSNNYSVVGTQSSGSGSGRAFTIGSSYETLGFNLGANYSTSSSSQGFPSVVDVNQSLEQVTHQNNFQLSASRSLGFDSANWSAVFSRANFSTDITGPPSDQTYDSFASGMTMSPFKPVSLSLNMMYTTNYSALLLGTSILPQNPGPTAAGGGPPVLVTEATKYQSSYLSYGAKLTYTITKHIAADVGADRRQQQFQGIEVGTDTMSGGVGYSTGIGKGQFSVHYGATWYAATTQDQSAIGHSVSTSYSHDVLGWHTSSDFSYSRYAQTALADVTSTGYGFGFNTSHRFKNGWNLNAGMHNSRSMVDGLANSDSKIKSFNTGLSMNKLSFSGSYSESSGNALQLGTGLIPGPVPGPIILPNLLVLYGGRSIGVGGGYQPTHNFKINASFSRSKYRTQNFDALSDNLIERLDIQSEYNFRQLHFVAGYSHLTQGIGITFNNPATVNSFYVGVSRHFDIF